MTPPARLSAVIEILDRVLSGEPSGKTLTNWARNNRYAGSKDRAAVRDIVFDCLRRRRSYGALGGADTGRGLVLGFVRASGEDVDTLFFDARFAPHPLSDKERALSGDLTACSEAEKLDCPDWLWSELSVQYGDRLPEILALMQSRAPVFMRVNLGKTTIEEARKSLLFQDIATRADPLSLSALIVTKNERRVANSTAYQSGLVEIQDAASQAVVDLLPLKAGQSVLDYCAGGGGKSLAIAARVDALIYAHDIDERRMADLPVRAKRAGATINLLSPGKAADSAPYDLVLCDAPCSGSGAWRRNPQDKWSLSEDKLLEFCKIQAEILNEAQTFVSADGVLAYATCSLLAKENQEQVQKFISANPEWSLELERQFTPLDGGDGLFVATLKRC